MGLAQANAVLWTNLHTVAAVCAIDLLGHCLHIANLSATLAIDAGGSTVNLEN